MAETVSPGRQRLLLAAIVSTVRGLGPLRRPLARAIGAGWYAAQPLPVRVRAARNHRRMQPWLSHKQAAALARRSYCEYVSMILDAVWAEPLTAEEIRSRVHYTGMQHLAVADQNGGVLAVPHFGNWDMAASAAMAIGRPMSTVMAPIGSPLITGMVELSRRQKGFELFTPQQAARGLARALRSKRLVALMADVPEAGPRDVVPYCGGHVEFSAVPARLAAATGRPIVPVACWRQGNRWRVQFFPPVLVVAGSEASATAEVAAAVEPAVRRHPEQWYPFHEVYVG